MLVLAHTLIDPGVTLTALTIGIAVGFVMAILIHRRHEDDS